MGVLPKHKPIKIHDTVHGYITLPWVYVVRFVDTPQFQRLRRIEQSAVRALYPTARHDRFTHSLGVYHVGCLIVEHFREEWVSKYLPDKQKTIYRKLFKDYPEIIESYKIACLLHDVGHAPFSHTLEDYFGGKDVRNLEKILFDSLNELIQHDELEKFKKDYDETKSGPIPSEILKKIGGIGEVKRAADGEAIKQAIDTVIDTIKDTIKENKSSIPKPHEFTSAIVCMKCYGKNIEVSNAIIEYVVRMILGVKFLAPFDEKEQLANIFIELLHGETIDADRLDYACRDTWASGYCTSTVDMHRLIYAMHIRMTNNGAVLCYNDKVVNEIESLLNIKDFQKEYIFNHHVIRYDQYLLDMAAKIMARHFFPHPFYDKDKTELSEVGKQNKALACFINVNSLIADGVYYPKSDEKEEKMINVAHIADEDVLLLMKQMENPYYEEWASRQYKYYPLWKTRDEYHTLFPDSIGKGKPSEKRIKKVIYSALKLPFESDKIRILSTEFKGKTSLSNLKLWSNECVMDYSVVHPHEEFKQQREETIYYVYYKSQFGKEEHSKREAERKRLIKKLVGPINAFYRNEK